MKYPVLRGFAALALSLCPLALSAQTLAVDAAADQGALRYGATGFLYGLGDEGIPSDAMLGALKPQVAAQKAVDGIQHPNGDALKTGPEFLRNGGRQIQIYMQDIYQQWPYEQKGMGDYLPKVEAMVKKVMDDPNRAAYVYVPLNEPDVIWYGGDQDGFYRDWKVLFNKIKAIDPQAQVCGPNYTAYDSQMMRRFMSWASQNGCVPDIMTWHELQNDFYTQWDRHLTTYRKIETDLKLSPRPIVINEYGRFSGDLGVPGHLIQYIARFERDGVDGCLAYWTTAGSLNDLVTANNQPTGGWWLYQWYAELTGHRVETTPPKRNAEGLQGLAALDGARKRLQILAGGAVGDTTVAVRNLDKVFAGQTQFHVVVRTIDATGLKPAPVPTIPRDEDLSLTDGVLAVALGDATDTQAYQIVVTPASAALAVKAPAGRLDAEDQTLAGNAQAATALPGYTGTGYVALGSEGDGLRFVVDAPRNGFYNLKLVYQSAAPLSLDLALTRQSLGPWNLAAAGTWTTATKTVFLPAGISVISLSLKTEGNVAVDGLDLAPATGPTNEYEAEAPTNVLTGKAKVQKEGAKGPSFVAGVGAGPAHALTFTKIAVPTAGTYWVVFTYANGELGAGASNYNANIVDRSAALSVNRGPAKTVFFRNTLGWKNWMTLAVALDLAAGDNSLTVTNPGNGLAPYLDKVAVTTLVAPTAPDGPDVDDIGVERRP